MFISLQRCELYLQRLKIDKFDEIIEKCTIISTGIIITFKAERSEKDAHCEKLRFYIRSTNILFICNLTLSELNIVNLTNIYLTVYMYKKT